MDFTLKILKSEKENQVFSPINIAHAFGLLLHGAGGDTETEIANILGYGSRGECMKSIEDCLAACDTDSIKRAANLFLNHKFDLHDSYLSATNEKLGAKVSKVDYSKSAAAAALINDWVSSATDGLIDTLITPDMLSDLTLLTLVTAILFKGKWEEKFETDEDRDFTVTSGAKKAKFMKLKKKNLFGHYEDDDLTQVIDIPYQDGLKMTVIMPKGNLEEFESTLTSDKMTHYFEEVFPSGREIILRMPKFKFGVTYDLKKTLVSLGHGKLFDQSIKHDYSKMTVQDIFISDAIHKATIEVDEEGTVAAAATGMVMMMRCMPAPPLEIILNKPFLFFIRSANHVIFAGRMADPTK
jgi:serpin B